MASVRRGSAGRGEGRSGRATNWDAVVVGTGGRGDRGRRAGDGRETRGIEWWIALWGQTTRDEVAAVPLGATADPSSQHSLMELHARGHRFCPVNLFTIRITKQLLGSGRTPKEACKPGARLTQSEKTRVVRRLTDIERFVMTQAKTNASACSPGDMNFAGAIANPRGLNRAGPTERGKSAGKKATHRGQKRQREEAPQVLKTRRSWGSS